MESTSPLSPGQQAELRTAMDRARSFLGAAKVAGFNGWTLATFAVLSVLFGLSSFVGLVMGLGLGWIARNEFIGRTRLKAFDPGGLELLWRNQLGLMGLIVGYCLWSMVRTVARPDPQLVQLTELLGEGMGDLVQSLTLTVYVSVIVATVIFQGLNARYYFVRIERLREYLRTTPSWVLDVQRSVAPSA